MERGGARVPEARKAANTARRGAHAPRAVSRMHSLGYLWEIGSHDVTVNRPSQSTVHPGSVGLGRAQPQPALASEARSTQSDDRIVRFISERGSPCSRSRSRRTADVATESHGDFHENRFQGPLHPHPTFPLPRASLLCVPRHRPAAWIATEGSRRRRRRECRRYRGYDLRCKGSLAFS